MVLVAGHVVDGTLHEGLFIHIVLPQAVEHDVRVDVPGMAVPVRMGADDGLEAGEIPFCVPHADLLRALRGEAVVPGVCRVKGNDVVVLLYFFRRLVLVEGIVGVVAFVIIGPRVAVDPFKEAVLPGDGDAVFVEEHFLRLPVMLEDEVVDGTRVIG